MSQVLYMFFIFVLTCVLFKLIPIFYFHYRKFDSLGNFDKWHPWHIEQSFYQAQINITFKESILQPSIIFRSVLEIQNALIDNGFDSKCTFHLYIMTDGGPEHHINFESVKITLILMFKQHKLDLLKANAAKNQKI